MSNLHFLRIEPAIQRAIGQAIGIGEVEIVRAGEFWAKCTFDVHTYTVSRHQFHLQQTATPWLITQVNSRS